MVVILKLRMLSVVCPRKVSLGHYRTPFLPMPLVSQNTNISMFAYDSTIYASTSKTKGLNIILKNGVAICGGLDKEKWMVLNVAKSEFYIRFKSCPQ